ncbi:hypothetical protein TNCV_3950751 [Trichonephila clavipes]|nr:hypothetical protein TNCV_3950751 [Trichonephila clavipes]
MLTVPTFDAPTPASSVPEGRHYGHPALSSQVTEFFKIRFHILVLHPEKTTGKLFSHTKNFKILIPHPETHTGLTFDAPAQRSSVAIGNKIPVVGFECKAFPTNSGNIRQSYGTS